MNERTKAPDPEPTLPKREGYPPGVTCWVDVELPEPEAAAPFYAGLFGWELAEQMPPDAPGSYMEATLDGDRVAGVGSRPEGAAGPPSWNTYVWVESADETAERIKEAGGTILMEPFDVMTAGRMAVATDPQGASFRLWQAGDHRGAQAVNRYGSWSFSGLATSDLDAAAEFYGRVFGWQADTSEEWAFFGVPGYGDYLAQQDPTLKERLAADDAPKGFADATAFLMSLDGMPEGTPPNWSVTFAVEDADAVAAKSKELGGNVLVPPTDNPPVRMAVLSDPQGAAFTVSRYYPPGARPEPG